MPQPKPDLWLHTRFLAIVSLLVGFAGTASAGVTVDTFDVAFNPLPSADITAGLTPTNLSLAGVSYPVDTYVLPAAGPGGFSELPYVSFNPWGATSPFIGTPLDGGTFDAIWNGVAIYTYTSPQSALTIL